MSFRSVLLSLLCTILVMGEVRAQLPGTPAPNGSMFLYWGYNRAGYSWSNIHCHGPDYDFTLRRVEARDRPVTFTAEGYFKPQNIWLPQYNYRLGWFLRDHWSLSLGLDHMKYVMVQDQTVQMDGYINSTRSTTYATEATSKDVKLTKDFLTYEHTDGLNLLSVDIEHYDGLWQSRNGKQRLHLFEGIHVGPMIPRSDVRLFGEGVNNVFHVAGVGVGAQLGLHFTFLDHFFFRATAKGSWVDLPSVLTTGTSEDRANQHFWAYQGSLLFGGQFRIGKKKAE